MIRDKSSEGGSTSINTPVKSPSPLPRTHSHSVSVPSTFSGKASTQLSIQPSTVLSPPLPPLPRYSTKPTTTSANSSLSTSSSSVTSTATSAIGSSTQSSQGTTLGTSPLGAASTVDVVGKRLREQQLQGRFKAAQDFIERTVGKPLPSSDLHESLKDGVILCRLANRLRPGTVEQISLKNLPFVKMENISNFLNAAKQLGVQSSDLFQTVDLYEGKDMNQVVSTILTLERVVGSVARMIVKDKRPGPSPVISAESTPTSIFKVGGKTGAPVVMRARSKTAHTPPTVGTTASIRPSSSAYYAAQVRKLEEESIRFANGYDLLESNFPKTRDRHQSTPAPRRGTPPSIREKAFCHPSLNDIVAGVEDMSFGSDELNQIELDAETRREQRDLVFGRTTSSPFDPPASLIKSTSGPLLIPEGRPTGLDMTKRKKKSISLDPQAANAVIGISGFREGYSNPNSPGISTQSASYNAISTLAGTGQVISLSFAKHHNRTSSEKTVDGTHLSTLGTPASSRSTTPVQGLRKSANSVEPLREKLELWENDHLVATFQLGNCIGRGQFGSVYKALNMVTGQMVAVKRIKIDGLKDTEMDILMQEVDLLKSLAHPSIVKYEGFIRSSGYLNIILEFVENGSLLTTLKSFGTFPEKLVVAYVVKILEGLVYLHGKEVVHCDLKAANILTTKNGNVKLSDFGVSLNLKVKESDFGAVAGTPNWMAPEVIELKGASPASDIWSLGCTVIEMLTGQPPYAELLPLTTLFRIVEDERPPLPSNLSVDLLDFLCQCFQKDPNLRPSAGTLGRHIWIKRNFTSRELKPMDSLPYMKRKSMEPKDKLLVAAALDGGGSAAAAKRASTPLGLSSGAPPPAASASASSALGRGIRRGSVDSASSYYSSTVPGPTSHADRHPEFQKTLKPPNQHTFVKSSFAKPVECKFCYDFVKKQAVICQDCSMVFHRKCQFYVGDTCFPGPHLSYFQSPSPAQSASNLKSLANGKPKGGSRPSSRTSQITLEDRSRSVTPSQVAPTPPPGFFSRRDSSIEKAEQQRAMSSPPPHPSSGMTYRAISPEGYPHPLDTNIQGQPQQASSQGARPSSRQSDTSPTSPTFSGLRNLISRPRRFSFGKKGAIAPNVVPVVQVSSAQHPLPTPPASYTSRASNIALNNNSRSQAGTPDSSKVSLSGGLTNNPQQRQKSQPPAVSPKSLPVPISADTGKTGSAERVYRRREYLPGGPFDPMDEEFHSNITNLGRGNQRPSSITLFSTSAPPIRSEYHQSVGGNRSGRSSAASISSPKYSRDSSHDCENDQDDEIDQDDEQGGIGEMNEEDLEALLVPSTTKARQSNHEPGKLAVYNGHDRVKSPNTSQNFAQQDGGSRSPSAFMFSSSLTGRSTTLQQQQQQQSYYSSGRAPLNTGYNSSGSSSAAMTSSYSSHSNNSSIASSIGSVATLIEEEERQLKEFQQHQYHHLGVNNQPSMIGNNVNGNLNKKIQDIPSGYQLGSTHSSQHQHVGIRTVLDRFSNNGRDSYTNNSNSNNLSGFTAQEKSQLVSQNHPGLTTNKLSAAYNASSQYPIQSVSEIQQKENRQQQYPQKQVPIGAAHQSSYGGGIRRKTSDSMMGPIFSSEYLNDSDKNGMSNTSNSNSSNTHQYPISGRRRSGSIVGNGVDRSSKPISILASNAANLAAATATPIASTAAAGSALKRGEKVIRRSMGTTLEKDRWD
ncbi:hypothetical protein FBU30_005805 [Linnemannia zychae]|nr:hypothetical protein FBU30_005805 [Linnemannia zychae]